MPFPIRQYLDRLTGLNRTERAVLTQIVELAEHGGPRGCYATNATLGERIQASPRTVCRLVSRLLRAQLLVQHGQTSHRTLRPSPTLRACYASSAPAACWAATQALGQQLANDNLALASPVAAPAILGLVLTPPVAPTLAIPGRVLTPPEASAIAIPGRAYREKRKDEKKEEKNENHALRAELARAKKKIAELEGQLAQQAASEFALAAPAQCASPPEQAPASYTGGAAAAAPPVCGQRGAEAAAYDPSDLPAQLTLPFASPTFRAAWIEFRHYYFEQYQQRLTGGRREQALLAALRELAGPDEAQALAIITQAIRKGWKDFYPLDAPAHASPNAPFRTHRPGPVAATPRYLSTPPNFAHDRA